MPRIDQQAHAIRTAYAGRFRGCRHRSPSGVQRGLGIASCYPRLGATAGRPATAHRSATDQPIATDNVLKHTPIPQICAETDACPKLLHDAIEQVRRAVEGARMVQVDAGSYFKDGIETEEQLDAALKGLENECAKHIGEGKKVFLK